MIHKNSQRLLLALLCKLSFLFPDKLYISLLYLLHIGGKLNLKDPRTFNEKIQWLKLYDRKPEYTTMVDKAAVKDYVANIIGKKYIIPTLAVYNSADEIDFKSLPNQFVLKTTHGGGSNGVIVCKDKSLLNTNKAKKELRNSLNLDIYRRLREWPYKDVKHKIIAEEYIEDARGELIDYKFFCFNGEPKAIFIATERNSGNVKFDFFDMEFKHLDIVQSHPMSGKEIDKPVTWNEMKDIARLLSRGICQVRVDLYTINDRVYFGEYTFCHHGGLVAFHPEKWDLIFGSWIELPLNESR